ncbi:MAG: tRNA (adenosine(37)-N6)-threonylcarbamoyltransferase complex dimerization subunit type 1 TsaB [Clostridia bacterium]|nr:tRNA (adenosine(37)-N6)-threonylcarbamoyltransferase complex dimerization subunit type 1 TsaB [Clostridia bacterium]
MKILSVECSASPASCAIIDNGIIKASSFVNAKLTHSQTLMQMIINTLDNSATKLSDIDNIAIAVGPGSFTGLRIGISAVKGLAAPTGTPCIPVSTLDGMAYNFTDRDCVVCAVMDARCNQFYNALFDIKDGNITRLCDDRALIGNELKEEVEKLSPDKQIIICGDGADLFYKSVSELKNIIVAPENLKFQNAVGIGMFTYKNYENVSTVSPNELLPVYLRLPQAERELKAKNNQTEAKV